MKEIWHFSEDPTIEVFVPHHRELHQLDEALVWAVGSDREWVYWFPRECPRVCWWQGERRIAALESDWLDRMRSTRLYAYKLPPQTFEPWDEFFISRETVVPLELVEVGDLLDRHASAGIEVRVVPALLPLFETVRETADDFSAIRLRNAVGA
ncbi:MAG: hypothetical protein QOG85_714 [Gaiellaceae bacterium]|nr:hypothetical protein [Gaiellaceae bacterium]